MKQQNPVHSQQLNSSSHAEPVSNEVIQQISEMTPDQLSEVLRAVAHRIHPLGHSSRQQVNS